jgi:aspartokinase
VGDYIGDIIVRSGLVATTYENLDSLTNGLKKIVDKYAVRKDLFVNFSRGNFETTLTCNQSIYPEIEEILKQENQIAKFDNVGAITIKLMAATTQTNGVYYSIFKMIANRGVNIVDIISTFKELTILVSESELDKAFVALQNTLK